MKVKTHIRRIFKKSAVILCAVITAIASVCRAMPYSIISNAIPVSEYADNSQSFPKSKVDEVLNFALMHEGISGQPNPITNYWNVHYHIEWCAMFIGYVLEKCGIPRGTSYPWSSFVDRSGECIGYRDYFEKREKFFYRWSNHPILKGYFVIFDYDNNNHGDHIGFVYDVDFSKNQITTIEGNANDSVKVNIYDMSDRQILGYCAMTYPENNGAVSNTATATSLTTSTTTATTTSSASTSVTTTATAYVASAVQTTVVTTAIPVATETTTTAYSYPIFEECYVSSSIGCNFRAEPNFDDGNIIKILDTDTLLEVKDYENGFALCRIKGTSETAYVHTSVIRIKGENEYNYSCKVSHYVSSEIGCNLRLEPYFDDRNIIMILDTYTELTVLDYADNGFAYCEISFSNDTTLNGYVHMSVISEK